MFGIGGWELFVIILVALVVLGPKGLPSAARAVGKLFSELRRATSDLRQSIELDPELRELPRALDELNRPLLSPGPYPRPRKRAPRDQPGPEAPPFDAPTETTRGNARPAPAPEEADASEAAAPPPEKPSSPATTEPGGEREA